MADDDTISFGVGSGASAPSPTPDPDTISFGMRGGDQLEPTKWTGAAGLPEQPVPWSDVGHGVAAGWHTLLATGASHLSAQSDIPDEWREYYQKTAEGQRQAADESVGAMTYSGKAAREGSFLAHPVLQTAEQVPTLAAMAAPAIIGTMTAGPVGGIIGGIVGFGEFERGQGVNEYSSNIMATPIETLRQNPDFNKLSQVMPEDDAKRAFITQQLDKTGLPWKSELLGGIAGAGAEFGGELIGKAVVNPLIKLALGVGKDAGTMAGLSAGQTYLTGSAEAEAGVRPPPTAYELLQSGKEGAESGIIFGVLGSGRHRDLRQTPGKASVAREDPAAQRQQTKDTNVATSPAKEANVAATPSSPVDDANKQALANQPVSTPANPTPTPGVEQQAEAVDNQPGVAQPPPPPSQTAAEAPPAPDTTGQAPPPPPPPPPPPASQPAPSPGPSATATIPEPTASLQEQQAALLDPANHREAMIYPPGVKPLDITQNKWRYGTLKLPDGRYVQYDTRGPRALSKAKILEMYKDGKTNDLLQLGPVSQEEAVQRSVAGENPAVVTERAPPAVPGEPGVERKAAEGTTATAPDQVAAMEAVKTPDSTVQVETHEQAAADRLQKVQDENVASQQAQEMIRNKVVPSGSSDFAPLLAEARRTGQPIIYEGIDARGDRHRVAAHPDGTLGTSYIREEKAAPIDATPRVEPTKLAETKFLSVWDRGDGTYFKRYADGREEDITKTVADLLSKQEPYKPAEKVDLAATRTGPAPERRILRSETPEEQAAAARQAEADRIAAERVAAEAGAAPKVKEPKPPEEIKPGHKNPEEVAHMKMMNAVADDVMRRNQPADDEARNKEALAVDPSQPGGKGARAALLARVKKMLEDAKTSKFEFKKRAMHRTDEETRHSNQSLILYEAKLLDGAKAADKNYGRFLANEHDLLTNGKDAYDRVLNLRKESGKETAAERGKPTGEAKAVEDVEKAAAPTTREGVSAGGVEKPDVAEMMHETKERLEEEKIAKAPGEERKLTENERRAQEASERAIAKLAEREKAAPSGVEGKVRPAEGEGRAEAPTPRVAAEFTVEKARPKWRKQEAEKPLTYIEKQKLLAAGWTDDEIGGYTPEEARAKFAEERRPPVEIGGTVVRPSRTTDAETAIKEYYKSDRFAGGVPQAVGKLRDMVVKIAGDTPVHFITNDEMEGITGGPSLGAFSLTGGPNGKPVIILNIERMTTDTPLHEAFHAATELAMQKNPDLKALMERLRVEVLKNLPDLTTKEREQIGYYLTNFREFLNGMMTNPHMQRLLKGVRISDQLARDIDIPKWRKMTSWNGVLHIIQKALGLEPRDVSAIEAAMSLTEQALWRDPRAVGELMQAAGRLAEHQAKEGGWLREAPPERDQKAVIRSPRETFDRVKDIDTAMVKQFTKDKLVNLGGAIMKGSAKLLSGTWLDDVHGHLFKDAKGSILQAINDARNKVSHTYNQLMRKDMDLVNRGYMLDRTHASQMGDYAKVLDMAVRYNIHPDQVAPKISKARKDVQRDAFGPEARALFARLHPDLQKRMVSEIKYAVDKQGDMSRTIMEGSLPLFEPPKGSTLEEVMERARNNKMTEDDWNHYEALEGTEPLREAYRLAGKNDVYANAQRDGRWAVTGRYEMPKGGKDASHSGESLPDNQREFDTEQQAKDYMAGTRMKATAREAYYVKDGKDYVDHYPKTPDNVTNGIAGKRVRSEDADLTKYRVSLERQNYQTANSRAEAQRLRQAMEADGVKGLSGVMDKRDEKAWSDLNTADQNLLERKIDSRKDLTDNEKQHMKNATRQMMLSSRGGMSSHMIQARKVAGAKFDSAAGLHAYVRAVNFHIARQSHLAELNDAMGRLDTHEKAMRSTDYMNAERRSIVANEMRNRVYGAGADALNSSTSPWFHKMMTWAFINFLARPSHIILSQLHPYIYSVPMIAARHGYWKAFQAQRQAMKDLGGMGHNLLEGAKAGYEVYKSGGEQNIDKAVAMAHGVDPILRMINGLKDKGERDALMNMWQTEHLHSAFDASVFAGSGMDRTNAIVRQFTDAMEANNRLSTALAAYRLEKAMHKDPANALAYSRRVIEQTHGVFSPTNAATVFKNPIMRGVMQFRQQPMNLAIMMYRNMAKALPEKLGGHGDNEARWTLAYQLGTAAALGGMGGMPMDLPKLVGLAGQAAGGPSPAEWDDKFYRTLVDNLGETAAKLIHDGLPGIMGPYGPSLGHRTGFDAGFLFGEPKSDSPDDLYSYIAKSLAGASVGMGADWLNAVHQAAQGDFERAGESILPGSLKDILKAYRNATQGVTAGKEEIAPGSFGDELLQIMGFSGIERERQMAGHFALKKAIKADQAEAAQKPMTYGQRLKAAQAARKQKTILGVKVGKKEMGTAREYEDAYSD